MHPADLPHLSTVDINNAWRIISCVSPWNRVYTQTITDFS